MKILVTGCNGFIGGYICEELKLAGHEVFGLGTQESARTKLCAYYRADISSRASLEATFSQTTALDAVIHCAARICYDNSDCSLMAVNAVGTQNILSLAKASGAKRFVYISSVPVIGVPKAVPVTEQHPLAPATVYHASKLAGEFAASAVYPDAAILRVPSPVGIGMNVNTILPVFVSRCLKNEDIILSGTGSRVQNYIAVRDVARAARLAVQCSAGGVFLLSGDSVSNLELSGLCKQEASSSSRILFSNAEDPADGQRWELSGEKAREQLGFVPALTLRDTVKELCAHLGDKSGSQIK